MFLLVDVMVMFVFINCFKFYLFLIFNEGKDILNDDKCILVLIDIIKFFCILNVFKILM